MKFLPSIISVAVVIHSTVAASEERSNLRKLKYAFASEERREEAVDEAAQITDNATWVARGIASRIVGGNVAPIDAYPFFVNWGGCGASLISREWVLTAAHCNVIPFDWVKINESRGRGDEGQGTIGYIDKRIPHPQYDRGTVNNDFMLIKLKDPTTDGTPVDLNFNNAVPANDDPLTVIGFGRLAAGGTSADNLREVEVQYVPTDECNARDSYDGGIIDETMLCAGVDGGGKDSCQGDSGGPIFKENSDGSFTQVGVVSFGEGCAEANYPGVYARVSGVDAWIKDTVCNDSAAQYKPNFCGSGGGGGGSPPPPPDAGPGMASPPLPPPGTGNGDITIRLDVTYDLFPDDLAWEFLQDGQVVAGGDGKTGMQDALVSYTYQLDAGPTQFVMTDAHGDGLCCSQGEGKYEIFATIGGNDVSLDKSSGQFTAKEKLDITIPGEDSTIPGDDSSDKYYYDLPGLDNDNDNSPDDNSGPDDNTGDCKDSAGTFWVDEAVGAENCDWLSSNWDEWDYLCTYFDVAVTCKVTCDVCSYWD